MDIREIAARDAEVYFALRRQADQECPQFVGLSAERELAAGSAGMADVLARYAVEGTVVLGGFENETLVGVVAITHRLYSPKYRHKIFLWGMYIVPERRDGSVARRLMGAAIFMGCRAFRAACHHVAGYGQQYAGEEVLRRIRVSVFRH